MADNEQLRETIINPNSSGQGYCETHRDPASPHGLIVSMGYRYSHSTPVIHAGWMVIHHTYEIGEHRVSWWQHSRLNPYRWDTTTSTASGRKTSGTDFTALRKHLMGKRRRYPELRQGA
jgi:hypothetical protein